LSEQKAECRGLYAQISADGTVIEILKSFPPGRIAIPLAEIVAIELIVNSVFPPIIVSLSSFILLLFLWWLGGGSWPVSILGNYSSIVSWTSFVGTAGLLAATYCWLFAKIRVTATNNTAGVTIAMIPRQSGERFVSSIRHMLRSVK
jgi:hypothetical protein